MFVLIAGPPGSGKSTLARPLAEQLNLPLIAKDPIKEALMDVLGWPDSVEESRTLGRAAVMAMLEVASTSGGAVLESTFFPYAYPRISALPGSLIEVRCRCPAAVAQARYRERSGRRHRGHLDLDRQPDELWSEESSRPLGIAPVIVVDTTAPVDVADLATRIQRLVRG
ncbi:MAG TPA: AAA family ATPase [Solirubrobacteraceae bacterium]|nr:AAA family ATPase [Solirubrobacteraceae bacterium]